MELSELLVQRLWFFAVLLTTIVFKVHPRFSLEASPCSRNSILLCVGHDYCLANVVARPSVVLVDVVLASGALAMG